MIRPPPRSTLFPYTTPSRPPHAESAAETVARLGAAREAAPLRPEAPAAGVLDLAGVLARDRPRVAEAAHVLTRRADEQRSEEHTSELQSRLHLVCRLLLEKK